ncbi:conserved hypothetical protein [Bradyrhizobium sp. STM 3809]|nr:conserved hypothetical protein [Bradyrhizobium sp. STM 3809]
MGGGYQIAWKMAGADLYTVWNTDSSGNYTGNAIGAVNGASSALEALETNLHQDLNGDGTIGIPSAVIETLGATSLVQSGSTYFMNPVGGGTGPQIKFGGSTVTVGQLGGWNPIGAEASGGGYLVAWKMAGADLYTVWNTDGSGNYTGNAIGAVPGGSAALETLETSFNQDLNNDGTIGVPTHVASTTQPVVSQDNFHFSDDGQGGTQISANTAPASSIAAPTAMLAGHDGFVFAEHVGQVSIADLTPGIDTLLISHNPFANQATLLAAIHHDFAGSTVITDAAMDTITVQHVTALDLVSHLSSFHLI